MQDTTPVYGRAPGAGGAAFLPFNAVMSAGLAWLDLAVQFQRELQRASLHSFSSYSPTADARITGTVPQRRAEESTAVLQVGEERLNVATQTVPGEVTRVRRRVVAQPVEQQVRLREEKVVVERRPPTGQAPRTADGRDVLTETVIEMRDSTQVPSVWKSVHVAGEVVLRKQVTERTETVRETVRRDVVDVEHAEEERAPQPAFQPRAVEPRREPHRDGHREPPHETRASGLAAELAGGVAHPDLPQPGERHPENGQAPEPDALKALARVPEGPVEPVPGDRKPGPGRKA